MTVTAVDDNNADDESVKVSHTVASTDDTVYDGLAGDMVTVTVDDDEVAVVAVSFGSGTYTVSEGDSVGAVGLGSALASNMTIQVTAAGGGGAVSTISQLGRRVWCSPRTTGLRHRRCDGGGRQGGR